MVLFLAVCGPKFMKFLESRGRIVVSNALQFPVVYSLFLSEDIRHYVSKSSNDQKCVQLAPDFFRSGRPRRFKTVC